MHPHPAIDLEEPAGVRSTHIARTLLPGADLERVLASASAVLLVGTHDGAGPLMPLLLSRIERPSLLIGRVRYDISWLPSRVRTVDPVETSPTRVVLDALAMLRAGGIVFMAGDVTLADPRAAAVAAVAGRPVSLPRGFADIALASGVPPTPIFSCIDRDGRVIHRVEPPLADGGGADRAARVGALVQTYADCLSRHFAAHPGNVRVATRRRHVTTQPLSPYEVFGAADPVAG